MSNLNINSTFEELHEHMFETAVTDNHVLNLIKLVVVAYCKIRLHHLAKEENSKNAKENVRKKLGKLVLFKHQ